MTNGQPPAPPRVADRYRYWTDSPPEPSARCLWWMERIEAGWRPNKQVQGLGYDGCAEYYGVWIWEWLNVLRPTLRELKND